MANKELLGEEAQARGEVDILSSGGCRFKGDVFENGEEWHPRIQPWGEMRCINCNCKVNIYFDYANYTIKCNGKI